jgi:hypothetical protein
MSTGKSPISHLNQKNLFKLVKDPVNSKKTFVVTIVSDKRICDSIFQNNILGLCTEVNQLKSWGKYFTGNPQTRKKKIKADTKSSIETWASGSVKTTSLQRFIYNKLPVVGMLSKKTVYKPANPANPVKYDMSMIEKSWQKTTMDSKNNKQWLVRLVLTTSTNGKQPTNKVNWDNNSGVYIEFIYLKKLIDFTFEDLNILHKHLVQFLQKNGGYDNNIKNYIVNRTAGVLKSKLRFLSDLFLPPRVINRTAYFNGILNNLKDSRIASGYNGIDYMAVIDSEKGKLYTFTPTYIDDSNITADVGFCLLSLVKVNDSFIIRNVVIENGRIVNQSDTITLNKTIEKFSKLLSMKGVVFTSLSDKNYKKCIDLHKEAINKQNVSFIEFSSNRNSYFSNPVHQWTTKQLTINFLCKACPDEYIKNYGKIPANSVLYILYLTCNKRDFNYINIKYLPFHDEIFSTTETQGFYFPLQFAPSTNPLAYVFCSSIKDLNNSMVDLTWNQKSDSWDFVNKSTQNTGEYGDSFKSIETGVWNSFRNPVKYSDLVLPINDINKQMYFPFMKRKNDGHNAIVKLNTFVKNTFIQNRSDEWVMDFAAGKAQDLWRYRQSDIKNLVMVEIDKDAVDIIMERKYEIYMKQPQSLLVLNTDLNLPDKVNLQKIHKLIPVKKVQYITCMFALHYLTGSLANIKNITSLIGSLLDSRGEFLYTAFDPKKVQSLLKEHNGQWDVKEDGIRKYSIIQKYKDSDIKDTKKVGWSISLTLPMNPEVYYTESLINETILDTEFKKQKMTLSSEGNFMDFMEQFKKKSPQHIANISANDRIFAGLYKFRLYKKA